MQGILVVNKEQGYTSFDVVAKLRGILKTKKIGHTGTLDPMAEGVLVCCIGRATKLVDSMINHDKTYEAALLLGKATDTYDVTGEVIKEAPVTVSEDEIIDIIKSFTGKSEQYPPMYSAKKVGGKKLYELAREGKTIERKPTSIEIYDIEIINVNLPEVSFRVSCSKGTYIRSLCDDIGKKAGCGGCMSALKRIKTGEFLLKEAHTLSEIDKAYKSGDIDKFLISVDEFLGYKKAYVNDDAARLLENGNSLSYNDVRCEDSINEGEMLCVYHPDGRFAATYKADRGILLLDKFYLE